jgi:hypothetical protein
MSIKFKSDYATLQNKFRMKWIDLCDDRRSSNYCRNLGMKKTDDGRRPSNYLFNRERYFPISVL